MNTVKPCDLYIRNVVVNELSDVFDIFCVQLSRPGAAAVFIGLVQILGAGSVTEVGHPIICSAAIKVENVVPRWPGAEEGFCDNAVRGSPAAAAEGIPEMHCDITSLSRGIG